jgi:hypothetical protein
MSYKYLDASHIANSAAYQGTRTPSGSVLTSKGPDFSLPAVTGLLNSGETLPVVKFAPTPTSVHSRGY